jgi:hypothetical protein
MAWVPLPEAGGPNNTITFWQASVSALIIAKGKKGIKRANKNRRHCIDIS